PFGKGDDKVAETFYSARCYSELMTMPENVRADTSVISNWVAPIARTGAGELYDAMMGLLRLREKAAQLIERFDFLLMPSVPVLPYGAEMPAPDLRNLFAPWCNNFLFNLTE